MWHSHVHALKSNSLVHIWESTTYWLGGQIRLQGRKPWFDSWVRKIPWRRDRLPTPVFFSFPDGSDGKESACNVGNLGSIPGLGRFPGGGHGNTLLYSCLENPHGQRSLAGYSPWDHKESDTAEQLNTAGWSPMGLLWVFLWVFCHCLAVFLSQNCLGVRWANAGYMLPTGPGTFKPFIILPVIW